MKNEVFISQLPCNWSTQVWSLKDGVGDGTEGIDSSCELRVG